MSTIERNLAVSFAIYENGNQMPQVPEGWTPYNKLGDYCSHIYTPENGLRRPVAVGPIAPLAIEQSGAKIVRPRGDHYKYLLDVSFFRPSFLEDEEEITSLQAMEVPTLGFKDILHGEEGFKQLPFAPGELWRVARLGLLDEHPRLAVPFLRFNTSAVSVLGQTHYSFDNSRFHPQQPSVQTYAPMTGNAEEFRLGINGTDIGARVRVTARFQGI